MLPKKSTLYRNILRDQDERGEILSIVDQNISNVSIIKCNSNTIRSNHYHLTDWHFMFVMSGKIDYFYKEIESNEIHYLEVMEGDNIFTPSLEVHATYFPVETKLIVSSLNPRDRDTYEKDTVRVKFVNQNNVNELLKIHRK